MSQGYYRYPTIAGDRIVFVCEDDLWSVSATGGIATRLTASFGMCSFPRFSPDGSQIAFISTDEGNPEVYVMPATGGVPERLTFLGAAQAAVAGWSAAGDEIFFVANPTSWDEQTRPFAVSSGGGVRELHLGHARSLATVDGNVAAIGRNAADPARWKRYRGGTAGEIWTDLHARGRFERLLLPDGNPTWPMPIGERVYFLADHEGIGNIYSCDGRGGDLRRHTHEAEYYVRFPSTDGMRIVYAAGGELGRYDVSADAAIKLDIETHSAAPQTVRKFEDATESLEHFSPHPDGTRLAFVSRGQAFTMPLFEGAVLHHGEGSRSRVRLTEWLYDGKRLAGVTDAGGYERIAVYAAEGSQPAPKFVTSGDIGRVTDLACSPVDDVVAFANHRHELCIVDLDDGKVRIIDTCPSHRIGDIAFSPDGRYVAYVWWPAVGTSIVRIAKVRSGKVHDVTSPLRIDQTPAWDPEGKYLYFISTRDFNPVYDALQFELSFPQAGRPFVVTLRDEVPSPFVPPPKPIHRDHERDHERDRDDRQKPHKPVDVDIDFDGISGRVLGFPIDEGEYGDIVALRERVLFTRFPIKGIKPARREDREEPAPGTLLAYDFEQQRVATIVPDCDEIRLSADGRTIVYRSHDRLRAIDGLADLPEEGEEPKPPSEPGRKSGWIELERADVEVIPRDEWAQMYREAWRLQIEQFWVEDMSDIDWDRVYDRYAAVLPRVRTRGELSDLIWEMQGELGTSHAYEYGGDYRVPPQYQRGFLGAELVWDEKRNGYRIEHLYRGDSWNREGDSPLAEPGLAIAEGDVIVAIGGKRLSRDVSPDRLLVNTSGRDVSVTLRSHKEQERTVLVKALESEGALRYRAWVERNRSLVHARTAGRVGYLHIPDMGPWGFSEFHRGFLSEFDRKGLIVDVRYNRGGHVSSLLLEKLARKRVGYDVPRYGSPIPYPPESVDGPIVALTNQFAGSDGDIFSHCFKLYGLGPLVGKRTWGGVIGIDPYHHLVDGTETTQPEYSFWFADVGWRVENYGTDPDYDVDIAPHDYRDGKDPQLDLALQLMEQALQGHTGVRPDLSTRPSLPLPTLR